MAAEDTRARILDCTVELIKERGGDISNVTIRTIADRAGVGVGLTNHYFKSKELLIKECVQTAFKDIAGIFIVLDGDNANPIEMTKAAAKRVMDFYFENEQLARVSILMDAQNPGSQDCTVRIVSGFAYGMVDRPKLEAMLTNDKISDSMKQQFREHFINEQRIKAFMLVTTLNDAFIRRDSLKESIGVDICNKEQRDEFVEELVEMLM